jgi:hypothetical protein
MAGGGGGQTTNSSPWGPAQPYLKQGMGALQNAFQNPAAYYPGQTFVGPTQGQIGGWDQRLNYQDQVFGGQQAPKFGEATGALSSVLGGQGFGTAGSLDARGAINSALSGTPDYAGAQGAVDAANAPIMRNFQNELLPSLNSRATFLNNGTGGIKTLNRVLPEMGAQMATNAGTIMNNERLRALDSQQNAAGMVSQGGLAANQQRLGGVGMFNQLAQAGEAPGIVSQQFADWGAGYGQKALNDQMGRFNYYQNLPQQNAQQYMGGLQGTGQLGGTTTQQGGSGGMTGALGGAAAGASVGSMFGPGYGTAIGAGIGGLMGMLG